MKPMLAHVFEPHRWTSGPAYVQPKFNGVRALYQAGHFQSRDELPWKPKVLAHLTDPLRAMFPDDRVILDGELYVHGWPLQRINGAVQIARTEPSEDTLHVQYWVFDSVSYSLPFYNRFKIVSDVIADLQHSHIMAATTVLAPDAEWANKFYMNMIEDGFEGIMYRLGDCPYTKPKQVKDEFYGEGKERRCRSGFLSDKNNRTWHLLKRKAWMDGEFECVGFTEGEGKRAGMIGALTCSIKNSMFDVGSGFTDQEAEHYYQHPPIGKLIKVKYQVLTKDGIPFNPTFEAVL